VRVGAGTPDAFQAGGHTLDGFKDKVEYALLLTDGPEIMFAAPATKVSPDARCTAVCRDKQTLILNLPVQKPPVTVPVVELFLKK